MSADIPAAEIWSEPCGRLPRRARPHTPEEAAAALRDARARGFGVHVVGGGSRAVVVRAGAHVLETTALDAVLAHAPGDQTITVQAGITLAALDARLAAHGQWLPVQQGPSAGTLGGLLATAGDAATDLAFGRVRERLLGAAVALPDGSVAHGRGRVVKNVAGYDLPRMLVGSHGCLGVLVQASLKLEPRPARGAALVTDCPSLAAACTAADCVLDSGLEPTSVDVLARAPTAGARASLAIGCCGSEARVSGQLAALATLLAARGLAPGRLLDGDGHAALLAQLDAPAAASVAAPGTVSPAAAADAGGPAPPPRRCVLRLQCLPGDVAGLAESVVLAAASAGAALALDARPGPGLLFVTLLDQGARAADVAQALLELGRQTGSARVLSSGGLRFTALQAWGPPPPELPLLRRVKAACDPTGVLGAGCWPGDAA